MKKPFKTIIAIILSLSLCMGFAGCVSEDNLWSVKSADETLPIGTYIYYLAYASSEATTMVADSSADVLSQTVEEKDAATWIKDQAKYYVDYYFAVEKMTAERNITLTDEELALAQTSASNSWAQMSSVLTEYGVAYSSFEKVVIEQQKLQKLFDAIYGDGGEIETTDEAMKDYFKDNYTYYKYAVIGLSTEAEDGSTTTLTGDDLTAAVEEINGWVDSYNNGEIDKDGFVELYTNSPYFASESVDKSEYVLADSVDKLDSENSTSKAILDTDEGKATVIDYSTSGMLYIAFKEKIDDKTEEFFSDETNKDTILHGIRDTEFEELVKAEFENLNLEYNTRVMDKQNVKKFFKK